MPKIKVNDISMYYEIHGKGEPMFLIPGFSADTTIWNAVTDKLAEKFQVILFDNRGAGQTDIPNGPYTIEQMVDDLITLCENLSIAKAHFVGSSMGGFILQMLAVKHPELVKSAIICNSTTNINCCFHLYVGAQLELIKAKAPQSALVKASCSWGFSYRFLSLPGMIENLLQFATNNPHPFTIEGYEGQYAALDKFNSDTWVRQMNVPTLVIAGDQDLIFNEKSIKALADKIPGAEYFCFAECGHLPILEYPEQFSDLVVKFVNQF